LVQQSPAPVRTGRDRYSPYFVTHFDVEEGDGGTLEDDRSVRAAGGGMQRFTDFVSADS
jgi:hypothetical protein